MASEIKEEPLVGNNSLLVFISTPRLRRKIFVKKLVELGGSEQETREWMSQSSGSSTIFTDVSLDLSRDEVIQKILVELEKQMKQLNPVGTKNWNEKRKRNGDLLRSKIEESNLVHIDYIKDLSSAVAGGKSIEKATYMFQEETATLGSTTNDAKKVKLVTESEGNAAAVQDRDTVMLGGRRINAFGIGCMPLGITYPDPNLRPSREQAIELLHLAQAQGCVLFDTADTYGEVPDDLHYCEKLLADAFRSKSSTTPAIIATKGGMARINNTSRGWRPRRLNGTVVRKCVETSIDEMGLHKLQLWQLHHCDSLSNSVFSDILAELAQLQQEDKIEHIGMCNITLPQLVLAVSKINVASVQNPYSLWDKTAEKPLPANAAKSSKKGVIEYCSENNIPFIPYGLFGGTAARDGRKNLERDFPQLCEVALKKQTTPYALLLRYIRDRWPSVMLPIIGMRSKNKLSTIVDAMRLPSLTSHEIETISSMRPSKS